MDYGNSNDFPKTIIDFKIIGKKVNKVFLSKPKNIHLKTISQQGKIYSLKAFFLIFLMLVSVFGNRSLATNSKDIFSEYVSDKEIKKSAAYLENFEEHFLRYTSTFNTKQEFLVEFQSIHSHSLGDLRKIILREYESEFAADRNFFEFGYGKCCFAFSFFHFLSDIHKRAKRIWTYQEEGDLYFESSRNLASLAGFAKIYHERREATFSYLDFLFNQGEYVSFNAWRKKHELSNTIISTQQNDPQPEETG